MTAATLRRYTNLAATLHILQTRCLTLLNPDSWDDRNDAFFIGEFKKRIGAQTVLALCFAEASETYHHWRVFSHGSDGVCIEFNATALEALTQRDEITWRRVRYMTIGEANSSDVDTDDLPFLKRYAYRQESEFRLIYVDRNEPKQFEQVPVSLRSIERVALSPWMPEVLAKTVKKVIRSLKGCSKLKVHQSTLVENERWKRVANPHLK